MRNIGYNPATGTYDAALHALQITKQTDDNVRTIILGMPNDGKSKIGLTYCYNIACYESMWEYQEFDRWEEFFNLDENAAIGDQAKLIELTNSQRPRGSIIFADELHMMINARNWQEFSNEIINIFFQLMRPNGLVLVGTTLESNFIDKQSRRLFNFVFEMGNSPKPYQYNVNMGKVKIPAPNPFNASKTNYMFPRCNNMIIDMCAGLRPPRILEDKYNKLRSECMKKISENKLLELEKTRKIQELKNERAMGAPTKLVQAIQDLLIENPSLGAGKLANKVGCSKGYAAHIKSSLNFKG